MIEPLPIDSDWPELWERLTDSTEVMAQIKSFADPFGEVPLAATLEAELQREIRLGHPLYGFECWAVARSRVDFNNFLFTTSRPDMPMALVHMTWVMERTGVFPYTVGYGAWEEFRSAWLQPDS